jgi:hypothetical protein
MRKALWLVIAVVIASACAGRPSGPFSCGKLMCDSAKQYCDSPLGGSPACKPLPDACTDNPSCTCMTGALGVDYDQCYCDMNDGCTIAPGAGAGAGGSGGAGGGGDAGTSDAGDAGTSDAGDGG